MSIRVQFILTFPSGLKVPLHQALEKKKNLNLIILKLQGQPDAWQKKVSRTDTLGSFNLKNSVQHYFYNSNYFTESNQIS